MVSDEASYEAVPSPPSSPNGPSPPTTPSSSSTTTTSTPRGSPRRGRLVGALMLLFVSMLLACVAYVAQKTKKRVRQQSALLRFRRQQAHLATQAETTEAMDEDGISLDFEVQNRYATHRNLQTVYPWLNGRKLIEPYMDTILRVVEPWEDVEYSWVFYMDSSEVLEATGSEIEIQLSAHGQYTVEVTASYTDEDGNKDILAQDKVEVWCKYVRRELRKLLQEDRKAFFDAAATLWTVSTEEGQETYGEAYFDIDQFTGYHLTQASGITCDHMHDGLGFFTQHAAMSIKFERSLQTVYPWVTLPYWDYTIDTEHIYAKYDGNFSHYWFESDVFDDDMFGRVDPETNNIATGRWAGLQVKEAREGDVMNGYGLMRAPWNANKDRGLKRFSTFCGFQYNSDYLSMPSCKIHYDLVAAYGSFEDFAWFLPYAPHGPIHVITGGTFGCEEAYKSLMDMGVSEDTVELMAAKSFITLKNLYREELLICPQGCSDDEDCTCSCPDLDKKAMAGDLYSYIDTAFPSDTVKTEVMSMESMTQLEVLRTICDANIMDGDQLEAASPFDISFWPIHPTIERLWVFKKLKGAFSDETWPTTDTSIYGDDCTGHTEDSVIPLSGILEDVDGSVTNGDLYKAMDPSSSRLPYIYDDFTWPHCLELDIDFSQLVPGEPIDDDSEVVN